MQAGSLCPSRRYFGDALDQVQCRQHEHLFRFGLYAEDAALLELPVKSSKDATPALFALTSTATPHPRHLLPRLQLFFE
jgi:hypothetical protein